MECERCERPVPNEEQQKDLGLKWYPPPEWWAASIKEIRAELGDTSSFRQSLFCEEEGNE